MTLIKSISGIRGTIGGRPGDNLTPLDIVKFTTAYVRFLGERKQGRLRIVGGRGGGMWIGGRGLFGGGFGGGHAGGGFGGGGFGGGGAGSKW